MIWHLEPYNIRSERERARQRLVEAACCTLLGNHASVIFMEVDHPSSIKLWNKESNRVIFLYSYMMSCWFWLAVTADPFHETPGNCLRM